VSGIGDLRCGGAGIMPREAYGTPSMHERIAATLIGVIVASPAVAPLCDGKAWRDFGFWLGEWEVRASMASSQVAGAQKKNTTAPFSTGGR